MSKKLAVITAASIGMVLTQTSSLRAENENSSAPEKVTKTAAPIDWGEEVVYSALPDEVIEKAGALGGTVHLVQSGNALCGTSGLNCVKGQSVKKPADLPVQKAEAITSADLATPILLGLAFHGRRKESNRRS